LQRLNRDQTELDLMVVNPISTEARVLLSEMDSAWINIRDDLFFLVDGRFLWTSERDGWRHLYLYDETGKLLSQLTSGEWQIDGVYGVDASEETVFFQANRGDLRQRHIYAVDLKTRAIRQIDRGLRGAHEANLSPDGNFIIDQWSTLESPPRGDLLSSDGSFVREMWRSGKRLKEWDLLPVEMGALTTSEGVELHSLLIKPRGFDATERYPVVLYMYGGPHSQLTQDSWGGSIHHTYRYFADQGMAVFLVDNRGTWGRGHAFETAVHRRLGDLEVRDQLAAVDWLKKQSWVDGDRIAVYGGSYGGYLVLMCMLKAPEVFRAGIAYAPVTDWRFYDTIYTERYMDTPEDNPEGYEMSAPVMHAENLEGALLLVHGMMDNNVHVQNTLQFAGKLSSAKKDFELMLYPQTRHGVRRSQFAPHFHRLKVDFLRRHLLDEENGN
ncbi:MAG: alpha/beta fold hydrolase, partial [Thermoanaerobaculales bacterium]|nr:alpha/beta fold hydrolase [Thermoanaerobaculales bacterium]